MNFIFYLISFHLYFFKSINKSKLIQYFYNENFCCKYLKNLKIIISLTSWPKRIKNVATVVKSLLNQNIEPDLIELNLCIIEFPNKEKDLPKELNILLSKNKKIEINWVKKNTGVFKKIIPTIQKYYGLNYYLLSVDDDYIYRKDYIELMVYNIKKYNSDSFCLSKYKIIGNRMIYKSLIFEKDFINKLTDKIIETRIDDSYINYYLKKKKKKMANYSPNNIKDIMKIYNPIHPNSRNNKTGKYSPKLVKRALKLINKIKFN